MPDLTPKQLSSLASAGASNTEIEMVLERQLNEHDRAVINKARLSVKLNRAKKRAAGTKDYESYKETQRKRMEARSRSGRNIGDMPEVQNPKRKAACRRNFRKFCESYYPYTFPLAWSKDHLKAVKKIEAAVLRGGLFALAMPRGSGKTTLAEVACTWAILYGHHKFVVLIASASKRARGLLESIQIELETNDLLFEDFPEAVYAIHCLERIHNRAKGQLFEGEATRITWTADTIVMPTIPKSAASGAVIRVEGIDGSIRGMKHKTAEGKSIRPSLVVVDDPQTDESAGSLQQNASRLRVLNGAILNLAGPGQKISGIMPCTVIRPDDMADQILDQSKYPAWQGERTKAIYLWPTNEKLWNDYGDLWRAGFTEGGDKGAAAVKFYKANRKEMDKGAEVAWEARKYEDDVSAIQHLMNHKFTIGDEAFMAEFQNEPLKDDALDVPLLSVDEIAKKMNGLRRRVAPGKTEYVTAMIDVHDDILYYVVAAWTGEFTGAVIDYGTYPDQKQARFSKSSAKRTMQKAAPGAGRLGAIRKGLDALSNGILNREYLREDGAIMRVERCLVDAGHEPDVVYDFCRSSPHAAILMPSLGAGIGAKNKPMLEYPRKRGDKMGWNWYVPAPIRGRSGRYVRFDTNHFKRFVHDRLAVAVGDAGCLTLWGSKAMQHIMFAEHMTAESPTMVTANGRTVGEWSVRPGRADNHLFDGIIGCAVAASMSGAALPGARGATHAQKRKRYR